MKKESYNEETVDFCNQYKTKSCIVTSNWLQRKQKFCEKGANLTCNLQKKNFFVLKQDFWQ